METYKKPVIGEKLTDNAQFPVEAALAVGFLTGVAGDFTPHVERRRTITERKDSHK